MSFFSISCFFTAVLTIILSVFIFKENPRKRLNQTWFLSALSITVWTFSLGAVTLSEDPVIALFWQRVLYIGTTLIPILYFNFCLVLLDKDDKKLRDIMWVGYLLSLIFIFLSFSKYFIGNVTERTDYGYWPVETGPFYWLFLLYFIFYVVLSILLLSRGRRDPDGVMVKKINYFYYASLVGFIGGSTNFLLDFDLGIYPFGNFFVAFFNVFITYAIIKYQLFNIKVIATEMFTTVLLLLISIRLFFEKTLLNIVISGLILVATLIIGVFLVRSVKKEVENREKGERLARYLANANARLRELDKQKTEFVSIASHQLRSPIAAIKGYTSMILELAYGDVPKGLQEPLKRVLDSGQRIGIMVDDFLNVTRIEQGRMTYDMRPHDVCDIVGAVVKELQVVAKERGLVLTTNCKKGVYVKADEGKLKQIFSNLIDNAIKYTPKGSITVSTSTLEKENKVLIKVQDTGIGIAQEEIPKLFQKFNRASNANEANVLGTGLGLYIAREIMKAHEGWIDVESPGLGKGSTFTVELPMCNEVAEGKK